VLALWLTDQLVTRCLQINLHHHHREGKKND